MAGRKWHKREIEILKKLYPRSDVTAADIAEILNRSVHSIQCKAAALCLKKKAEPEINVELLRKFMSVEEA